MVLAQAERRLGLAERLARPIADRRDQIRTTHAVSDILRARILAIACGYEVSGASFRCKSPLDYARTASAFGLYRNRHSTSGGLPPPGAFTGNMDGAFRRGIAQLRVAR